MPNRHIALLLGGDNVFDHEVLLGIAAFARERARWRIVNYRERDPSPRKLPDHPIDGIICRDHQAQWLTALRERQGAVPTVHVTRDLPEPPTDCLVSDDATQAAHAALDHLRAVGIERFGFVGLANPNSLLASEALSSAAGPNASVDVLQVNPDVGPSRLANIAVRWLAQLVPPVGVVLFLDRLADPLLEAADRAQLNVPDELCMVGMQNDETICYFTKPPLSSLDLDLERIGFEAAALLERRMDADSAEPVHLRIPPRGVIARGSSDRRHASDPLLAEALRLIHTETEAGLNVTALAEALGVARKTLDLRFRKLGRPPSAFIRERRLELAATLIAETDLPFADIATRVGFTSHARLCTRFRERFGVAPSVYRAMRRRS